MLATPRSESVGEPEEIFLVDCFENRRDRLLDDFVLQAENGGAKVCHGSGGIVPLRAE